MRRRVTVIAATFALGVIAACGGGEDRKVATVSGTVADGYLVGARVFLDKNGNYRLDTGEPSTVTDSDGAYTLQVEAADVGKYPVVAFAIQDVTVDKDTNQAVNFSYILSLPKESVSGTVSSNFISPMSTLVRELIATGNYTLPQAMQELREALGLPPAVNMMADYMADRNNPNYQAMHTASQNTAALMGSQMDLVMPVRGSNSVEVNRYRGMMGSIFSNISSVGVPGSQEAMTNLRNSMMNDLQRMPVGEAYRNMSSSFRGGMMGAGTGRGHGGSISEGMHGRTVGMM